MFPVSDRFLAAVQQSHRIATRVTATPPGGDTIPVRVTGGDIRVDADARIRRRGTLRATTTAEEWATFSTDGCLFTVEHGVEFSPTDIEYVPIFTGEAASAARSIAPRAGEVALPLQDLGAWIARTGLLVPQEIPAGTTRTAAIAALVSESRPGTVIVDTTNGGGTLQSALVIEGSRADAITTLATDARAVTYFDGAGNYVIRPAPSTTDRASLVLQKLITIQRERPLDRMYNTVIVSPSAVDGSQTWEPQIAQITDPTHPRSPSKIGVVEYRVASPTARTAASALSIARITLDRVIGNTETLNLSTLANPALEAGDVVRIATPAIGEEEPDIVQHFIDSMTINITSGAMSLATRSQTGA